MGARMQYTGSSSFGAHNAADEVEREASHIFIYIEKESAKKTLCVCRLAPSWVRSGDVKFAVGRHNSGSWSCVCVCVCVCCVAIRLV